jgi:hypothetical protein
MYYLNNKLKLVIHESCGKYSKHWAIKDDISDSPSSLITESLSVLRRDCARLLRKTLFMVPV